MCFVFVNLIESIVCVINAFTATRMVREASSPPPPPLGSSPLARSSCADVAIGFMPVSSSGSLSLDLQIRSNVRSPLSPKSLGSRISSLIVPQPALNRRPPSPVDASPGKSPVEDR